MLMIAHYFRPGRKFTKTVLIMKLTAILILAACLQVSAKTYSQNVTLSLRNAPLQKVFKEIKKQTGYNFLCTTELLDLAGRVNLEAKNISLQDALQQCFQNTPLTYTIVEKTIVIKQREQETASTVVDKPMPPSVVEIKGRVIDENGYPLVGASVVIKKSNTGTQTNADGFFTLDAPPDGILVISFVGYESKEIPVRNNPETLSITLRIQENKGSEIVVIGYGTARKKDVTGSISTVNSKDFQRGSITTPEQLIAGK